MSDVSSAPAARHGVGKWPVRCPWPAACAAAVALVLLLVLLLPQRLLLGAAHTDLVGQFIAWRSFAAASVRAGDFPFWNPYTFGGQPFLGGFQSALLYPPNVAFLALPLERALNFSVLLHLVVLAAGMAYWVRARGLGHWAAAMAGLVLALSGVVWPHVYAGHLSNLCTMAWVPWTFAGIEAWARCGRARGLLLATAAVALQILAGQMQYVFFFGVAAGVHGAVVTALEAPSRRRALLAVLLASVGGAALAAAQLLPGLEATGEGVRQGTLDYRFASAFALPPENLLTALAPGFFGDAQVGAHPYWGRCYAWEMSVFFGVSGLVFVAIAGAERQRRRQFVADLAVMALLLVLALGRHTPVYRILYEHAPGFAQFRGMSKFTFPALLFGLQAMAAGVDRWMGGRAPARAIGYGLLGGGLLCGAAAGLLFARPEIVAGIFDWAREHGSDDLINPPTFPSGAATYSARAVGEAAATLLACGALILGTGRRPRWRWTLGALLAVEMATFAVRNGTTTSSEAAMPAEMSAFVAQHPGDYRVLNLIRPNNGYLLGAPDLWGNDPGVLRRYAEFMTFTQGGDPAKATQNVAFNAIPPLYGMLRCRYAFVPTEKGVRVVDVPNPMPHVALISEYRLAADRDGAFAAMSRPDFDPRKTVILERQPEPAPVLGASGTARVLAAETDALTIEATVSAPALLLVTDLYASAWRARALEGAAQSSYEILPANYILRAIPLGAGTHRLRLEYRPRTFSLGLSLSALAWLGWIGLAGMAWRRRLP